MNLKFCQGTIGQDPADKFIIAVDQSESPMNTFEKKTPGPAYRDILAWCQHPSLLNNPVNVARIGSPHWI
jgi:hypothetical protein